MPEPKDTQTDDLKDKPQDQPPQDNQPQDEPKEPITGKEDPLLASLWRDLGHEPVVDPADEPEDTTKDEPQDEPADDAPADEPQDEPADEPTDDPVEPTDKPGDAPKGEPKGEPKDDKPKAKKKVKFIEEAITDAPQNTDPAPAAPPPPAQDSDAEYVESLTDDQKLEIEEAGYAETAIPGEYKGLKKKLVGWYKDFDQKVEELRKADPGRTFDEDDAEFQSLLKTKPVIKKAHQLRVRDAWVEDRVAKRVQQASDARIAEIERKQRLAELQPRISRVSEQFRQKVKEGFATDEDETLRTAAAAMDSDEVSIEKDILTEELNRATDLSGLYVQFANDAVQFDANNPDHILLGQFVTDQCEHFAKNGGDSRVRDGRSFVTRSQMAQLSAAERAKHWTFSDMDVLRLLAFNARANAMHRVKSERAKMEKYGLTRAPKQAAPAEKRDGKPGPEPRKGPQATVSKAPGAADKSKLKPAQGSGINVVQSLGLRTSS